MRVKFPGFGIHGLWGEWLHQEIRPGVTGALAPAYAITTHVAQGQTMDAGRAVITDTTAPEAAYVALTRGRNDARLYVLDSPARIARQAAADAAEFPVLLDEPELLKAVADRLQRKAASETATSVNQSALDVHRLSLLPISQIVRSDRHRDEALAVALDRVQLRALLDPPAAYIDDYGQRPENDHPNRAGWDRVVGTRARHEAMHGPWTTPPVDPALSKLHTDAKTGGLDNIDLNELLVRIEAPTTAVAEIIKLEDAFRTTRRKRGHRACRLPHHGARQPTQRLERQLRLGQGGDRHRAGSPPQRAHTRRGHHRPKPRRRPRQRTERPQRAPQLADRRTPHRSPTRTRPRLRTRRTPPTRAIHPHVTRRHHVTEQLALFDLDPLLDKHQVAQRLNVGIRFVERLIAEKRIAYVKVGRHVRVRSSVVDGFIGQNTIRSA